MFLPTCPKNLENWTKSGNQQVKRAALDNRVCVCFSQLDLLVLGKKNLGMKGFGISLEQTMDMFTCISHPHLSHQLEATPPTIRWTRLRWSLSKGCPSARAWNSTCFLESHGFGARARPRFWARPRMDQATCLWKWGFLGAPPKVA